MAAGDHADSAKAVAGWVGDVILGTGAVGAWLLEIE